MPNRAQAPHGDPVVLFAEGVERRQPGAGIRSALIGRDPDAARPITAADVDRLPPNQGMPMGRQRPLVAWYGDLDFTPHFKEFVRRGAVDVTVSFGAPVPLDDRADRKALARRLEAAVRRLTAAALRDRTLRAGMAA